MACYMHKAPSLLNTTDYYIPTTPRYSDDWWREWSKWRHRPRTQTCHAYLDSSKKVIASLVTALSVGGDTTVYKNPSVNNSISCPLTIFELSSRRPVTHDRNTYRILEGSLQVFVEIRRLDCFESNTYPVWSVVPGPETVLPPPVMVVDALTPSANRWGNFSQRWLLPIGGHPSTYFLAVINLAVAVGVVV
jgi:hypothetical protein